MARQDYQILMDELDKIAEKVGIFPESLHKSVFHTLVEALVNSEQDEIPMPAREESEDSTEADDFAATGERDQLTLIELYEHARFNDMEFSALTALYFAELVTPDKRTESIGPHHLIEACQIVGRKEPSNAATTLNNTLHVKDFLENTGSWGNPRYQLTSVGRKFLASKLPNKHNPSYS